MSKMAKTLGRMGGRSRSEKKRQAVRSNLAKARQKRWPYRPTPPGLGAQPSDSALTTAT